MTRIILQRPFRCDVLVFDVIGAGLLHKCLPDGYRIATLDIRDHKPLLLDPRFFYLFFRGLLSSARARNGRVGYTWLSALLECLAPRLILSCADNNSLLARYAEEHPQTRVVLLQNAMRDTKGSITPGQALPTYLAFGEVENKLFQAIGIRCRDYRPIGSVKLGLALAHVEQNPYKAFDLSFVSHYRPEMFTGQKSDRQPRIEKNQRHLFQLCCKYTLARSLSLAVITKTRDPVAQAAEQDYYNQLACGAPLCFVCADKAERELDSYFAGLASELVVHPGSTLGFELYAAGKKVILGATIDPMLINTWGIKHYVDALPDLLKLKNDDTDKFFEHCDMIRAMPNGRYHEMTHTTAQKLVSMPENNYPHEKIKALISGWLDS